MKLFLNRLLHHFIVTLITAFTPYLVIMLLFQGTKELLAINLFLIFSLAYAAFVLVLFVPLVFLLDHLNHFKIRYTALAGMVTTFVVSAWVADLIHEPKKVLMVALFSLVFGLGNGAFYGYLISKGRT